MDAQRKKDNDLGERLTHAVIEIEDLQAFQEFRRAHEQLVSDLVDALGDPRLLEAKTFPFTWRPKTVNSVIDKLKRQTKSGDPLKLTSIRDIVGARIVLPLSGSGHFGRQTSLAETLQTVLTERGVEVRTLDKRQPGRDTFGYRAIHLEAKRGGKRIEVQIRTVLQDHWAQIAEKWGDRWGREHRYAEEPAEPDLQVRIPDEDCGLIALTRREAVNQLRWLSGAIATLEESGASLEPREGPELPSALRATMVGLDEDAQPTPDHVRAHLERAGLKLPGLFESLATWEKALLEDVGQSEIWRDLFRLDSIQD